MYRYTRYRIKEFCLYSGALQGASTGPKKDGKIAFRAVLRIVRPTYPFQARSADSNLMMPITCREMDTQTGRRIRATDKHPTSIQQAV